MERKKIWDSIIFGTEADLDMLECRLMELDPFVHRFVISESRIDPRGKVKPQWYLEHRERFSAWADKILYVDATEDMSKVPPIPPGPPGTYWDFEDTQRNSVGRALGDLEYTDILMHGDTDEIPKPWAFEKIHATVGQTQYGWCLGAQHHPYVLDWTCGDNWRSFVVCIAAQAPRAMRNVRGLMTALPMMKDGSWHLSWFGGIAANLEKFDVTVHADIPQHVRDDVASGKYIREGWHWQGSWVKLKPYRGDDLPVYVRKGLEPAVWHKDGALAEWRARVSAGA